MPHAVRRRARYARRNDQGIAGRLAISSRAGKRVLAIDAGNSRVKFGLCDVGDDGLPVLLGVEVATAEEPISATRLAALIGEFDFSAAIASGSNPPLIERLIENWPGAFPSPQLVSHWQQTPLKIDLPDPEGVGMDRVLNAVAANRLRPADRPIGIVSAGTATTVDLVDARGTFVGGAILPGAGLAAMSLHNYTALLPLVDPQQLSRSDVSVPGKSTRGAIAAGILFGQVGAVRELLTAYQADNVSLDVVITGGAGSILLHAFPSASHVEHLPLRGLALLARSDV